ncbi:gamma-glutamyl-gamma-aminobutyrate hydrolase family protein [Marinobacter sp. M1N3S26]|uniref:gamma-glutamyl-gamma-aminobutyrate hydrolase family protein n=1 Tax=unclassified Marinobacter TaxID=83889 RepID=UPI00387B6D49
MRIGITQRVEVVESYGERRDCLDQQWGLFLEGLGLTAVPVPNRLARPAAWMDALGIEGLLLTGGNDLSSLPGAGKPAPERDHTEASLLSVAKERKMPVLGVCRGMQMINHWLGGQLDPVEGHTAVRHGLKLLPGAVDFIDFREVNSFHDWAIHPDGLASGLTARCQAPDGTIEACTHDTLPWVGIMWHPERETPFTGPDQQLFLQVFREPLCRH